MVLDCFASLAMIVVVVGRSCMTAQKPVCLTIPSFTGIAPRFTSSRSLTAARFPQMAKGPLRAFAWGVSTTASTIFSLVLFVTYIGIGALVHDTHFPLAWAPMSTRLV